MKYLDYPPIWLFAFCVVTWFARDLVPLSPPPIVAGIGIVLVVAGLLLMAWAVTHMTRARTTVIPHRDAAALVTSGPFKWTRNPIYLGDASVLLGLAVGCGSIVGVVLVPVFITVINRRFIEKEEARLGRDFRTQFDQWSRATRRWL